MKRNISLMLLIAVFAIGAVGQTGATKTTAKVDTDLEALAKASFTAHGGDKLKKLKTLVVRGSVEVTTSAMAQAIPGGFSTVISGSKYILDIQTPFQSLKQVSDGTTTTSSIPGFELPPVTSLGFPMLPRLGDKGYAVSALPEAKKKAKGFRLTAPDGFYTDFLIDEKTNLIKGYESAYEVNGRNVTTSVAVDKNLVVDGITVPEKYSQRFDLGQLTAYANFKAKEILINSAIDESVFAGGK